jgi:GH15 family glucan-1,4-alpha-glucosidase
MRTVAVFEVSQGVSIRFTLAYHPLHRQPHFVDDAAMRLEHTATWWQEWTRTCQLSYFERPQWKAAVERSVITLKALSYAPSGGIRHVAMTCGATLLSSTMTESHSRHRCY